MSLIKSKDLVEAQVRRMPLTGEPRPDTADGQTVERRTLAAEAARLSLELEQSRSEVARLQELRDRAREEDEARGYARGHEEGETAGRRQADATGKRLAEGLRTAVEALDDQLGALERLAPALALTGLERMLGDASLHAAAVRLILAQQLRLLRSEAVLAVEVSARDFADADELAAVVVDAGQGAIDIRTNTELAPGAVRIRLRLGTLEVGLDQQWSALRGLLAVLGEATPP